MPPFFIEKKFFRKIKIFFKKVLTNRFLRGIIRARKAKRGNKKMTFEQLVKRLKRLPKGEYSCGDLDALFVLVANKSEYSVNWLGDRIPKTVPSVMFEEAFEKYKYGLEYGTDRHIRYIGTNELETLIVD